MSEINKLVFSNEYKVKSVIRQKIESWEGPASEIALYFIHEYLANERNIQFLSYPEKDVIEGEKYSTSVTVYLTKKKMVYKIVAFATANNGEYPTKGKYVYNLSVFNQNEELIFSTKVMAVTEKSAALTSMVSVGKPTSFLVTSPNRTGRRIFETLMNEVFLYVKKVKRCVKY